MLFLTLDWGLGLLLLFLIIPLALALPCGFVQYLISSKVKDRVVRNILLVPLPTLGLWLLWLLSQKPLLNISLFDRDIGMIYVAFALLGTFLRWLLGWAARK